MWSAQEVPSLHQNWSIWDQKSKKNFWGGGTALSPKIISRLTSLTISLSADPAINPPPNFSRNRSGVGKIVDFRHLSRHISEMVQDMVQVAIAHQ